MSQIRGIIGSSYFYKISIHQLYKISNQKLIISAHKNFPFKTIFTKSTIFSIKYTINIRWIFVFFFSHNNIQLRNKMTIQHFNNKKQHNTLHEFSSSCIESTTLRYRYYIEFVIIYIKIYSIRKVVKKGIKAYILIK